MSFLTDIQPYIVDGLTQDRIGSAGSGNGLLFTAEHVAALIASRELTQTESDRIIAAYAQCEIQPGLYARNVKRTFGQEGPDDYIGIGFTARYLKHPELAQRVLDHGKIGAKDWDPTDTHSNSKLIYNVLSLFGLLSIKNVWNNENPGLFSVKAWLGRMIQLQAHMKFAAGVDPSLFQKLYWCVSTIYSAQRDRNDHDAWILGWMSWMVAKDRSWLCNLAGRYWAKKFKVAWPDGLGSLLCSYFVNKDQPLGIYLQGVFEV